MRFVNHKHRDPIATHRQKHRVNFGQTAQIRASTLGHDLAGAVVD